MAIESQCKRYGSRLPQGTRGERHCFVVRVKSDLANGREDFSTLAKHPPFDLASLCEVLATTESVAIFFAASVGMLVCATGGMYPIYRISMVILVTLCSSFLL